MLVERPGCLRDTVVALVLYLGRPVVPFYPLLGEGAPTKMDYRKKVGTLILTSLLEDLVTLF